MIHPLCVQKKDDLAVVFDHYKKQLELSNALPVLSGPAATRLEALTVNWAEVLTKFVGTLWQVFKGGHETDVKAAIIEAATKFYDDVVAPMLAQAVGGPLLFAVVNPLIRSLVPQIAGGIIDGLTKISKGPAQPAPGGTVTPTTPGGFVPY